CMANQRPAVSSNSSKGKSKTHKGLNIIGFLNPKRWPISKRSAPNCFRVLWRFPAKISSKSPGLAWACTKHCRSVSGLKYLSMDDFRRYYFHFHDGFKENRFGFRQCLTVSQFGAELKRK